MNPVERDLAEDTTIKNTPKGDRQELLKYLVREHQLADNSDTTKQWLEKQIVDRRTAEAEEGLQSQWEKRFRAWLVGQAEAPDRSRSLWNKGDQSGREVNLMRIPSVRKYILGNHDKRVTFEQMIDRMKKLGPIGLYGKVDILSLYIYFKYVVADGGMNSQDWLDDFASITASDSFEKWLNGQPVPEGGRSLLAPNQRNERSDPYDPYSAMHTRTGIPQPSRGEGQDILYHHDNSGDPLSVGYDRQPRPYVGQQPHPTHTFQSGSGGVGNAGAPGNAPATAPGPTPSPPDPSGGYKTPRSKTPRGNPGQRPAPPTSPRGRSTTAPGLSPAPTSDPKGKGKAPSHMNALAAAMAARRGAQGMADDSSDDDSNGATPGPSAPSHVDSTVVAGERLPLINASMDEASQVRLGNLYMHQRSVGQGKEYTVTPMGTALVELHQRSDGEWEFETGVFEDQQQQEPGALEIDPSTMRPRGTMEEVLQSYGRQVASGDKTILDFERAISHTGANMVPDMSRENIRRAVLATVSAFGMITSIHPNSRIGPMDSLTRMLHYDVQKGLSPEDRALAAPYMQRIKDMYADASLQLPPMPPIPVSAPAPPGPSSSGAAPPPPPPPLPGAPGTSKRPDFNSPAKGTADKSRPAGTANAPKKKPVTGGLMGQIMAGTKLKEKDQQTKLAKEKPKDNSKFGQAARAAAQANAAGGGEPSSTDPMVLMQQAMQMRGLLGKGKGAKFKKGGK